MSDIASQADRDAIARAVAERTLLRHGARIIAQGWSCPEGSIDFIAEKDGELVLADARMAESTAREDMERPVPGETVDRWERVACALASQAARELPDMRVRHDHRRGVLRRLLPVLPPYSRLRTHSGRAKGSDRRPPKRRPASGRREEGGLP